MSSIACEIWFPNPIDYEAFQKIDTLIQQIGAKTSLSENLWKEIQGSAQFRNISKLPIDTFIDRTSSEKLKHFLLSRRDYVLHNSQLQIDRTWTFKFADSSPLEGAPNAAKYYFEDTPPTFAAHLSHDLWRLMTGWGTSEFSDERGKGEVLHKLEQVFTQLNYLPFATLFLIGLFPHDCLLLGYLALWIMENFSGLLRIDSRTVDTLQNLDQLWQQNQTGDFPGKIYRFSESYETANGTRTYVWHVIDAEFLRAWIVMPDFNLS
jgi:hypothetical protein